ncbi:MAG: hypothetical protein ACRD1Z_20555, partial [Vicinamibacteria bacterium]
VSRLHDGFLRAPAQCGVRTPGHKASGPIVGIIRRMRQVSSRKELQMQYSGNPFAAVDKQSVIGTLKATGSKDPDVLHKERTNLLGVSKFIKVWGTVLMICGGLVSRTIILAIFGIPMAVAGWWMRHRAVTNMKNVEAGYG